MLVLSKCCTIECAFVFCMKQQEKWKKELKTTTKKWEGRGKIKETKKKKKITEAREAFSKKQSDGRIPEKKY